MSKFLLILLASSLYLLLSLVSGQKLLTVLVLVRHGARTPSQGNRDPFSQTDPWIYDASLTQVGMRQEYTLGKYLRL